MSGLSNYPVIDISRTTLRDAIGTRRTNPVGTCVHHTGGTDSRAILTGHHGAGEEPVSSDCLITKNGTRYELVPEGYYAYGVGLVAPTLKQQTADSNENEVLLSAELEYKVLEFPTYQQYDSLAEQVTIWALRWGWRWPYVLYGHYGIAYPPGRKYDPYLFDWGAFMGRLLVWSQQANIGGL